MTAVDWTRLEPHRPLSAEAEGRYVVRPDGGATKLVSLVRGGANPIAVVGPVGSGKSTEMMIAVRLLLGDGSHVVSFHMFDHYYGGGALPTSITAAQVLDHMTGGLWALAPGRIALSSELTQKLLNAGLLSDVAGMRQTGPRIPAVDLLRETLREIRRADGQKPAVLLCDGLEKYPADAAHEILDALMPFQAEATLVAVVPTSLVYGPANYNILSSFRLFPVRPVPVRDEGEISGREGREFLKNIIVNRLDVLPRPLRSFIPSLDDVLDRAAEASGGIPRAFLQLVLDAATYARLAQRELPTQDDLSDAMSDHAESLRRLLVKGDLDELRAADGTDGLEVDEKRRLRFLAHGLLLEYKLGDRTVVHPAPLLGITPARRSAA